MTLSLIDLAELLQGKLLAGKGDSIISGQVCTDSRTLSPGCLFIALAGEKFDGNDFAAAALEQGASAIVVSKVPDPLPQEGGILLVKDTLAALHQLAAWWRSQLTNLKVIGITGSNGKTSTKDLTVSVLSSKYRTIGTKGNLNNHIGVPLSILSASQEDEVAVWEMGMNHKGELAPLCDMIRPETGIITHIGTAHIEFMGSSEAIAEEKSTLAACLPESGALIYPSHDKFAGYLEKRTRAAHVPVGGKNDAFQAREIGESNEGIHFTLIYPDGGTAKISLPVPGEHMVSNALLAAAAGWTLGLDKEQIAQGLNSAKLTTGRLRLFCHGTYLVVDDTYNANPDSMMAALDALAGLGRNQERRTIAVLGKMGELGEFASEGHARVGAHAVKAGIDLLITVGEEASQIGFSALDSNGHTSVIMLDYPDAAASLSALLNERDIILFKGSRSAAMETIMNQVFPTES